MMKKIGEKKAFYIVWIQFLISAASVWLVLGAFDAEGNMNTLGYAAGVLFWLGMAGGVISYIAFFRKEFHRPNIFKFFSNKPAMAADGMLLLSIGAVIILASDRSVSQYLMLLFLFLLLISLYSHFLLNGRIFTEILLDNKEGKGDSEV